MARKRKKIQHDPVVREFARRLRAARRRLGLSQYSLAAKARVGMSYIGKAERAELAPGIDTVARLAEVLGLSVASLVGGRVQQEPDPASVARALREAVEKLLKKDNVEAARALAVIVAGLSKGASRR